MSKVVPLPKPNRVTVRWVESSIHRKRTFEVKAMEWWETPDRLALKLTNGKTEIFPWEVIQRVTDEPA